MKEKKRWLTTAWLLAATLGASCAPAAVPIASPIASPPISAATVPVAPATPNATPKSTAEQPRYGGILTISASVDLPSLDIHQEGTLGALEPLAPAYNNVVHYDLRTGKIVGDLADSWQVSSNGLEYVFHLRKGVKWHDAKSFSSEDVRYTLDRQKNPPQSVRSRRKEQFDLVDRIEAPDENTVKIVMKQPYVAFMDQFATDWFVIFPKHVLEAKGDMKKDVLGTGPFKFKSYGSGVSVELVKNPDYFMKGLPYLDGITHYIIKDAATRFSAFRTGRVKMTGHWASLSPSEAATVKAEHPNLVIWNFPALQCPGYVFNTRRPPFNDPRVQRAVSLAYDRQTAIKVLGEGQAKLGTFLPPGPWGLPEQDILKLPGFRQPKDADRAEAKKLLADAGYADGFKVTLLVKALRLDQQAGEFLQNQLATIGVSATIEAVETAVYNTRTAAGTFQIGSGTSIWRINDPDELSRKFLTGADQNYGHWSVKKFDDLFMEQSRTLDVAKRKAIVRELDEILLQESPQLWPYWSDGILGTWPEVKNFGSPPGLYSSMRLHDIWLAK